MHLTFRVGLQMARLLRSIDSDDRLDLSQPLDMHDVVFDLLTFVDDPVRFGLGPHLFLSVALQVLLLSFQTNTMASLFVRF